MYFSLFKYKLFLLVLAIVVLGFFLRFNQVTQDPPSLNWDEVSIGFNAYSILKTGRDEWNQFLPLHFKSYGEYKLPVQIYGSIPAIAIFGLNDFGVRITPVVYGTITILLMFFLGRALLKNSAIGVLAAFLLAISPWHIQLTRASFESSFSVFWIVLGTYLMIKSFKTPKWLLASFVAFALAIYTYNSARIFTPIFLAFCLVFYYRDFFKNEHKKILVTSIGLFIAFLIPVIFFAFSGAGSARYKLVSVTDDPGLVLRINEARGNSRLPQPLPRLIYNKVVYIGSVYIKNYIAHFTPEFLFVSGAPHKQHHVQGVGELYAFQAPFLLLGLIFLFRRKEKYRFLIIGWLLLAFIPVAVTNDSIPHALRTLIAVPTYQLLTAYGLVITYLWLKKQNINVQNILYIMAFVIVAISIGVYLNNYYNIYPKLYSRDWQYGNEKVVDYIAKHQDEYDLIVYSRHYGEPHMFTLFYLNYDPAKFAKASNLDRFETHDWIRVLRFDKYYFPDLGDPGTRFADIVLQNPGKKILFIGKPGDFPPETKKLLTIDFLNGSGAFEIVSNE